MSKPGKRSPAEFQLVQGHAQASYDVLKVAEFPWPVAQVARFEIDHGRGTMCDAVVADACLTLSRATRNAFLT